MAVNARSDEWHLKTPAERCERAAARWPRFCGFSRWKCHKQHTARRLDIEGGGWVWGGSVFICLARSQSSVPMTFSRQRMRCRAIRRQVNALSDVFLFVGLENGTRRSSNPSFYKLRWGDLTAVLWLYNPHSFCLIVPLDKCNVTLSYIQQNSLSVCAAWRLRQDQLSTYSSLTLLLRARVFELITHLSEGAHRLSVKP